MKEVSAFDWATLAIALGGLITAIVAIVWQAVTWQFTGARVRVSVSLGMTTYHGLDVRTVLIVTARNVGRTAIEVDGWGVELPDGRRWVSVRRLPGSAESRFTLDGGHHASWLVPLHLLGEAAADVRHATVPFRGSVSLGTGTWVTSKALTVERTVLAEQVQKFANNPIP